MKNNPYVGPRPYEKEDRRRFFGRDSETLELVSLILSEREVLVYAQSGAGKTSLFNAAVIPTLEDEHHYDVLPLARVGHGQPGGMDPAGVPNIFVFSTLLSLAGAAGAGSAGVEPLDLAAHSLSSYLKERFSAEPAPVDDRPRNRRLPLLVFDQFEEIFTAHRSRWQEAQGFFDQVREALDALPRLGVVFSMREEYVAMLDPYLGCFFHRLRTRFRLEPLKREGALEAIQRPAEDAGHPFDKTAAGDLADNLRRMKVQAPAAGGMAAPAGVQAPAAGGIAAPAGVQAPAAENEPPLGPFIEPVQLQVVCSSLWESLPDDRPGMITTADLVQYGDVDMALENFYNRAVQAAVAAGDDQRVNEHAIRDWFEEKLITTAGTRGSVFEEKEHTGGLKNTAVAELDRFHIIRAEVRANGRWYELSHDRMVDPVLKSNGRWKAVRETPLRVAARRWDADRDNVLLLYSGKALDQAQAHAASHQTDGEMEDFELDFLKASQAQEEAVRARRRRIVAFVIGGAVLFVAMLVLTIWAIGNRQEAVRQKSAAQTAQGRAVEQAAIAETERSHAEEQAAIAETAKSEAVNQAAIAETERANADASALQAEERARAAEIDRLLALSAQSFAEYQRCLARMQDPNVNADVKMALEVIAPKYQDQSQRYEQQAKELQKALEAWRGEHGLQEVAPEALLTLEVLRAMHGSSFLVHYGLPGSPRSILIDGGPRQTYRKVLKPRLDQLNREWQSSLRLIIATEIHEDSVGGLAALIEDLVESQDQSPPVPIKIDALWSNAVVLGSPERVYELAKQNPKYRMVAGAKMLNIPLNEPFTRIVAAPEAGSAQVSLDEGLTITVLGPRVQWLRCFTEYLLEGTSSQLFEALGDYDIIETFANPQIELRPSPMEIANPEVPDSACTRFNYINGSGTVFMLEKDGKRILFSADASSDIIRSGLAQAGYTDDQGNMDIDVLVIPHHGAPGDVSEEFFRKVKARYYVISSNGKYTIPGTSFFEKLFAGRSDDPRPFTIALSYAPEEYISNYPVEELCAYLRQEQAAGIPFEIVTPRQDQNSFGIDLWSVENFVDKGERNAVCGLKP